MTKTIALLTIDNILNQPANVLLCGAVLMTLVGAASPYVFGFLAIAMPWLCRIACFIYLGLAAFKTGWQLTNRVRAIKP